MNTPRISDERLAAYIESFEHRIDVSKVPGWALDLRDARAELDRALTYLWRIRMAAERSSIAEDPFVLPNLIISLALLGMGTLKNRAQEVANADRH